MRSDVLQVLALSAHGSQFLRGADDRAPELLISNSTFAAVHAVEFRREGDGLQGGTIAEGVAPWLRRLRKEGVTYVRPLLPVKPSPSEGDPVWGLLTDGDRGLEIWRPEWRKRFAGRDDAKPNRVTYFGARYTRWLLPCLPLTADAVADLHRTLAIVAENAPVKLRAVIKRQQELAAAGGELGSLKDLLPIGTEFATHDAQSLALRSLLLSSSLSEPGAAEVWRAAKLVIESAACTVAPARATAA